MAGPAEHATITHPRRRAVWWLVAVAITLLLLAAGYVYLREHCAYHEIMSCYSDNMYMLKTGLEQYVGEHGGQAPTTFDELRAHMKAKYDWAYDICVRAEAPFVWMPEGVADDDGRPVILMCPPNSHGWLRKYSFGLVRDGDTFRFVRVRGKRATPFPE